MSNNKTGQKQAVVKAVANELGTNFQPNSTVVSDVISSEQLNSVQEAVFNGILNGTVDYSGDTSDQKTLRRYVNGMVKNHFRKAKELNGGVKYTPSNPGNGRRDPQLANLKKLLKKYDEGSDKYNKVLQAISDRETELTNERKAAADERKQQKIVERIDTSTLSPELASIVEEAIN